MNNNNDGDFLKMGGAVKVTITNEKGETVSFRAIGVDYKVAYNEANCVTDGGEMFRCSGSLERILTLSLLSDEVTMKRKGKEEVGQVQDLFAKRRTFDFSQTSNNNEEI